ncbi:MAG: sodium-dependent transporter [Burkholderiaceae bacterium]|nr:sodium-dependent transporter [Burkholderiaceae bacterium]
MNKQPEKWSGRIGFILATIGSAVGIGSIWKFPYEVGANGGGTFVLLYVIGLVLVVVPLMVAEFALGRRGRADPSGSIAAVATAAGASRRWAFAGVLGVLTGFLILSFYAVIGGWTLGYAFETALYGLPDAGAQAVQARYDAFLASPWRLLAWHAAFMATTAMVVARGVARGIETASMILMPLLVLLMLALAAWSIAEGGLADTLRFLLEPDLRSLTPRTVLEALGLGFFSIGVGLGLMITYAAYSGAEISLKQVAVTSVIADTLISLLAGLAVFPIVFSHGLDPASGPGLVFVTLPLAFAQMPFGTLAACAFFVLVFVAALASAISLLELVVSWLMRRQRWRRAVAAWSAAATCFVAGIATVLSFNLWADWHPLAGLGVASGATVFELIDQLTSNLMLPLGGLAIALFAGWIAPRRMLAEELRLGPLGAAALGVALRYVVPAGIVVATLGPLFVRG